jgi:hypothetical protein
MEKTLEIELAELREQIAKEIVGELLDHPPMNDIDSIVIQVIKDCADIARGNK